MIGYLALGLLAVLLAFGAYIRLAPSDPVVWHVRAVPPLPATGVHVITPIGASDAVTTTINSARAFVSVPGKPKDVLQRLDKIALATPGTTRLEGSPEEGMITWVTRSAFWGFPDYTTAEAMVSDVATSDLAVFARSRFGRSDLGVNAARLRVWLLQL
jgi:uncharacterized protein (DUF1499 family)